jgi:hypothetical protein
MRRTMASDLKLLLAASRSDHPHHKVALQWAERALAECQSGGSIEILPMIAAGFLHLATNPKIFVSPTPVGAAMDFLDSIMAAPGVEMPELGREWSTSSNSAAIMTSLQMTSPMLPGSDGCNSAYGATALSADDGGATAIYPARKPVKINVHTVYRNHCVHSVSAHTHMAVRPA